MASRTGRWELPPDPQHIGVVRRQVASFAARAGMAATPLTDLQVAVSDALTTAVIHADGARDVGGIRVRAEEHGDELVVRVRDDGGKMTERPSYPVVGPRMSMIAALADQFQVRRCEGGTTELSMRFTLGHG